MKSKALIVSTACALMLAPAAMADLVIDLGGGWQATIFNEDNVDLAVDFVSIEEDILVIQKFANFTTIDPFSGQPDPVRIAFNQIADDDMTVSRIVLTDELIFNNTGLDWTSYQEILLGGNVAWNQDASADFSIDPFTTRDYNDDSTIVTFAGGVVGDKTSWTPGIESGGLLMDIDLSGEEAVKFVLKEVPLPGPGALALLGIAGMAGGRRRRA